MGAPEQQRQFIISDLRSGKIKSKTEYDFRKFYFPHPPISNGFVREKIVSVTNSE